MKGKKRLALLSLFLSIIFICAISVGAEIKYRETKLDKQVQKHCKEIGNQYGICPELLLAVIETESGGDADAVGEDGVMGLMQVMKRYHTDRMDRLRVGSLYDPKGNILVAADYLSELFSRYEDPGTVLMVYNGSKDALERGRNGSLTEYAKKVLERSAELERVHGK